MGLWGRFSGKIKPLSLKFLSVSGPGSGVPGLAAPRDMLEMQILSPTSELLTAPGWAQQC